MRSFFKRVVGIFSGLVGAGRRMMTGVWGSRIGDAPVRGTKEFLEVYETSPWVRAVAGRVSSSVGSTVWTLEGNGKQLPDHILLKALRRPNPVLTGHQHMKATQLCLDLVGDAFWLKSRNGFGAPVEFWLIPPHWVAELPTPGRPFFRVSQYSWQEQIPDTEIVWLHDAAPVDPYRRGSGLVRAQADEIETHEYASKHAKQLFFNRAIPEFVVMDPGADTTEMDRHEQAFNQRLQGFWRWYKPYFANRDLKFWQPQQMNLENLTMVPLMKHERDAIIQAWGIPPEQLGIIENSNRATIDGSDYVYESRIVKPRRELLRDELRAKLVPEYDERLVLGFVDTVPADKEHTLNVAKAAPHSLTLDEWRELAGFAAVDGDVGGLRLVPLNSYLTADPGDQSTRPQAAGAALRAGDGAKALAITVDSRESLALGETVVRTLRAFMERLDQQSVLMLAAFKETRALAARPQLPASIKIENKMPELPPNPTPIVQVRNEIQAELKMPGSKTKVTKRSKTGAIEETETVPKE